MIDLVEVIGSIYFGLLPRNISITGEFGADEMRCLFKGIQKQRQIILKHDKVSPHIEIFMHKIKLRK